MSKKAENAISIELKKFAYIENWFALMNYIEYKKQDWVCRWLSKHI